MMFYGKLAVLASGRPRAVVVAAFLVLIVGGVIGMPASVGLSAGGFDPPSSESARAERVLAERFEAGGMTAVFEISSPAGVDDHAVRARARSVEDTLRTSPHTGRIVSYWSTPYGPNALLVSQDHRTGLIATQIAGDDSTAPLRAHDLAQSLTGEKDGVTVAAGGQAVAQGDIYRQSRIDLILVEAIAVPLTFIALIWVFGSVMAAMLPIIVAVAALVATMAVLRTLSMLTDVSVFALNLATALCLALAIDYSLLIINRYREHVSAGLSRDQAVVATMTTTGRTVTYSALTVAALTATMIVFPMPFLRSMAYAGLVGAGVSLAGALLVVPAVIVLLGDRIDACDIRKPIRRRLRRPHTPVTAPQDCFFHRIANYAMRHAVAVVVVITTLLVVLGLPSVGMKLGYPDDRVLPASAPSRQAGDVLREHFTQNYAGQVVVVLEGTVAAEALNTYAADLSRLDNISGVAAPDGIYMRGTKFGVANIGAGHDGDRAYLTISSTEDPFSAAGKNQLDALGKVPAPAPTLFYGMAQRNIDLVHGIWSRVPLVLALIAVATFVLMFLLTGSLVLPIKALVMNVFSLTAAFGAMVWIFQDGHLGGLGVATNGYLTAAFPPLIFCLAYGLSMDYEVFVISRIREEWVKTSRTAADNQRAIAFGLARTGRIVTAAAILMAIVFAAIIASQLAVMRMIGTTMAITVLLDAFLIRILLVPALMRLTGRINWWAPKRIARWHEKQAFTENSRLGDSCPSLERTALPTDREHEIGFAVAVPPAHLVDPEVLGQGRGNG
jgi:putative drug exporter of the RND superfamily